jgi:hypothetical protein
MKRWRLQKDARNDGEDKEEYLRAGANQPAG